ESSSTCWKKAATSTAEPSWSSDVRRSFLVSRFSFDGPRRPKTLNRSEFLFPEASVMMAPFGGTHGRAQQGRSAPDRDVATLPQAHGRSGRQPRLADKKVIR